MTYVARDFNTENSEIGDITIYLCNNNQLYITIMNLHDMGQAWMYVKYPSNINVYDMYTSILNTLTHDIYQQLFDTEIKSGKISPNDEFIKWEYKDIVSLKDDVIENSKYSVHFGNYIDFTRESVDLLKTYDNDENEDDEKYYIMKGEYYENGEFIYNKPILSNDYYEENY
jgi:hypothetical protein